MIKKLNHITDKSIYYRLIALWVLCEAMLGGIIHGFKIPVSGLVVGTCAIACICLIAWYVPGRGAIIRATVIVAIFKMMLSPQAPPPAYIAVFFQGLLGELLFFNRRFFKLSCILLAVLGLLESGLQRILVLTLIYGNDLWKVINNFINGLTKQKITTNYSLLIGSGYVLLHLLTGLLAGWWIGLLPGRINRWGSDPRYAMVTNYGSSTILPAAVKKRRGLKKGLFIVWLLLIALYVQSYFKIGTPLLPSHISLKILLRSLIIVLGWIFIVGPLVKQLLRWWLKRKQASSQPEIQEVLRLLPATQQLVAQCWKQAAALKGWKRLRFCTKMILVNSLRHNPFPAAEGRTVYMLTAAVHTGKTTSLLNWSAGRSDVEGILTPVINGKRVFMNAATREQFLMEAGEGEAEIIPVGRFVFSKAGFEKAAGIIRDAIPHDSWLMIDEIGPLELRGEGFHDVLKEVLAAQRQKVILVVRDKDDMVAKVKELMGLVDILVIKDINEMTPGNAI